MPYTLKRDRVLLCEGSADKAFFLKLAAQLGLPEFDIPFPQAHAAPGERVLAGKDAIPQMLQALRGSAVDYRRLKAVLIAVDSGNDPMETFGEVCRQIRGIGGLGIPDRPLELAESGAGHPGVAVLLVPGGRPGSLETLCVEAIAEKSPELLRCVDEYLSCGPIMAGGWDAEKRDKAKLQCLIAATNRDDPNRTIRWAFDAVIPLVSNAFSGIRRSLTEVSLKIGR
jgi:hypothetical protein